MQTLTHPVEGGIPTTRWAPLALQVETMTTTKMTIIMIQDTRDAGCDKSLVQMVMVIMVMFMMMNGSTVQPSCDKCQKLGDDRDGLVSSSQCSRLAEDSVHWCNSSILQPRMVETRIFCRAARVRIFTEFFCKFIFSRKVYVCRIIYVPSRNKTQSVSRE